MSEEHQLGNEGTEVSRQCTRTIVTINGMKKMTTSPVVG